MSKVCIFHTTASTLAPVQALAAELMPDVEFMHIVEDALIKDVMKSGGPDADINARIAMYMMCADRARCDIFMTACSSIGEVVERYRSLTNMTVTRIDEAMAEAAIDAGTKIAVLATVETTLRPTLNLISPESRGEEEGGRPQALRDGRCLQGASRRRHRDPQPARSRRALRRCERKRYHRPRASVDGTRPRGPRPDRGPGLDLARAEHEALEAARRWSRAAPRRGVTIGSPNSVL
jgi:hypothetical protein